MKLSLYQIEQEYLQLAEALLANGGEVTEEMELLLSVNKENLETKATNYGFVCKQLEVECAVIDGEIERLSALKKSRAKTVEKLKQTLSTAMQVYGVEKIESPVMKISFRKSETTEIDDAKLIPVEYVKITETKSIDKTAIKEAIKGGADVPGAHIQINQNIQIK